MENYIIYPRKNKTIIKIQDLFGHANTKNIYDWHDPQVSCCKRLFINALSPDNSSYISA